MRRLLIALFPLCLAPVVAAAPKELPDRPGVVRVERREVDREKQARDALPKMAVTIAGTGRFARGKESASFAFNHEPGSVLGQLDLTRIDPRDETTTGALTMRVYLHGQGEEQCALEPGTYRLHAAFWIAGKSHPLTLPRESVFTLKRGQTGTLTLDRDAMRAIKKWLHEKGE